MFLICLRSLETLISNKCKYCNKIFSNRQNVCGTKIKENQDFENKKLELELVKENNIRLKEEARILNYKLKLAKSPETKRKRS